MDNNTAEAVATRQGQCPDDVPAVPAQEASTRDPEELPKTKQKDEKGSLQDRLFAKSVTPAFQLHSKPF
jgi:hypothetical protein